MALEVRNDFSLSVPARFHRDVIPKLTLRNSYLVLLFPIPFRTPTSDPITS